DPLEALYLVFIGKLAVIDGKRELTFEDLMKRFASIDEKILSCFLVYRDLRERGYVVKRGYGEGIDFLVYDKGDYPEKPAKFRIIGVDEGIPMKIERLIDILHFSIMNKKELKLAVIERRGEVVYYTLLKFIKEKLYAED
ncbi:tRNA-intron lyase, partial [Candidatus Geothermarchaeota archaeon]